MYEEMVKRLQDFAAGTMRDADAQLAFDAADVIEKMSKLADAIPHVCECCVGCELEKKNGGCDNAFVLSPKRAMQYLIKPRWIPVEERLPEEYVDVLCYCSRNGQYGCGEWSKEDNGTIYWTGLYGMIPTHWMPLPEPPKEDKTKEERKND